MKNYKTTLLFLIFGLSAYSQSKINDKVLLVLDIQKLFTETTISDSSSKNLINNTNLLIADFNPQNVVYIQSIARVLNVSFKGFRVDTLPNLEFDSRLNIVSMNIYTKNKGNAFTSADLTSFIEKTGINEIIVVGLLAENCVKETLLGGKKKAYKMYYIPEAVAAKNSKSKMKTEKKLYKEGIKAISLSEITN